MFILVLLILLSPFTLSLPTTKNLQSRADPLAIYTLTNFRAFVSSTSPNTSSSASFHLSDPRADHALEVDCSISGTIYRPLFTKCGNSSQDASFWLSEGQVVIKRGWRIDAQNYISTYAPQGTYWKDGDGGNATKTQDGTTYTRTSAWAFPVKSASIVG